MHPDLTAEQRARIVKLLERFIGLSAIGFTHTVPMQISDALDLLRAHDALAEERDRLREALGRAAPYTCPSCGPHVKVDEDECCVHCGADAALDAGTEEKK